MKFKVKKKVSYLELVYCLKLRKRMCHYITLRLQQAYLLTPIVSWKSYKRHMTSDVWRLHYSYQLTQLKYPTAKWKLSY